ncbi:MAG: hypothetical protein ACRD15_10040, partial [Vicinamibacterales bacterium]
MPAPHAASAAVRIGPAGMSPVIVCAWLAIVWGVLAFGAVYPWAYWPLLAATAFVGIVGLFRCRGDVFAANRSTLIGLVAIGLPILVQLIPMPREALLFFTPQTHELLGRMSLSYATASGAHPVSVDPAATLRALLFVVCLGVFVL